MDNIPAQLLANQLLKEQETLRDKFAMAALTGNLASCDSQYGGFLDGEELVKNCFKLADQMLEARKEKL